MSYPSLHPKKEPKPVIQSKLAWVGLLVSGAGMALEVLENPEIQATVAAWAPQGMMVMGAVIFGLRLVTSKPVKLGLSILGIGR